MNYKEKKKEQQINYFGGFLEFCEHSEHPGRGKDEQEQNSCHRVADLFSPLILHQPSECQTSCGARNYFDVTAVSS